MFNGRHGSGHGHASLGSVTISLNKEDLIGDPGRFTYQQDSVIRSSLKRQWMHNTVDVDNKEGFIINGAWSYDEIQDPISNNYVQDGNYIVLESSWVGKSINKLKNKKDIQGEELYIIKRTVFIQSEMNIVIIFTNIEYPGKHKWRSIYNIEQQQNALMVKNI
nr:heparinase II/III family protein [Clostridium sartagoforme]